MAKIVFLKGDCSKFIVRVYQEEFIEFCISHGASPTRIAKLNGMNNGDNVGELLLFETFNTFLYEVQPNESFKSICDKFNLTAEELYLVNQTYEFYPWQMVEIPNKN